jgi:alpha-galactosidase
MGWNSWNQFGCNINEDLLLETADALVQTGMKNAGYEYIVIDDCWQATQRDNDGNLVPDPNKFPHGMAYLADAIHRRGLKIGLYTSIGAVTCQGFPGSLDHEAHDAWQFARWGIDFVKDDFCTTYFGKTGGIGLGFGTTWWNYRPHYAAMSQALKEAGDAFHRPIIFSICNWGFDHAWQWAPQLAHLWRTSWDIKPSFWWIKKIIDSQKGKEIYSGPGHWNDPDMLEVGVHPLTEVESRAHFSMWAILAAPLFAGNDLRNMPAQIREILTDPEVIALDQDPLGIQGKMIYAQKGQEVWLKPLKDSNTIAVALLNRRKTAQQITVRWSDLGIHAQKVRLKDLWKKKDLGIFADHFSTILEGHGVVLLKLTLDPEDPEFRTNTRPLLQAELPIGDRPGTLQAQ